MLRKLLAIALVSAPIVFTAGCGSGSTAVQTPAPTAASITLSASTINFPSTTVGNTSATQSITVTNNGGTAATLNTPTITGTNPTDFALFAGSCGNTLVAGGTCTINIVFSPLAASTFTATLTVTSSAANSTQTVALTGTGTPPVVTPAPVVNLSPTTLTFTGASANIATPDQTITLANNGNAPLLLTNVQLTGTNASAFTIDTNNCPASLAALSSCAFGISFTAPAASSSYTAALTLTDNNNNVVGSTQTVAISGTSGAATTCAQATLTPGVLTFAATTIGNSAGAQTVTLANPCTVPLTGIAASITGGTASSAFTISGGTCGGVTMLAPSASCTYLINFTPSATGTFLASLSVTDSATGSPQTVTLNGVGQAAPAPIAGVAPTVLNFPATTPGNTSAASIAVLSNTGTATLNIASIVLGGTNSADFAETTTCGTTLAVGATCNISVTFKPIAAATYTATVTITDNTNNVAGSTQVITLNGTGGSFTVYHTLIVIPEPDNSVTPLYTLINGAQKTIDMTMYEMQDTTFTNDLVARCNAGVIVRVIFSASVFSSSATAYNALNTTKNCAAEKSNTAFTNTHQKTITVDNTTTAVLSLNLQSQYYSTTRDYGIIENDPNDISAIEATFAADWAAGTPYGGTQGASDFSYQPAPGTDLIWSPTTATAGMLAIINNATKTLYIECEEFSATNIVNAVAAAAQRGVAVILIGESTSYLSDFATIKAAGAQVWYYTSSTGFYVHAKSVVADLGLSTEAFYIGSINYSSASLTQNRELGIYVTGNTAVSNPIAATVAATTISDESQAGVTKY